MYPKFLPSAKFIKQGLYLFLLNIPFIFILDKYLQKLDKQKKDNIILK